MKRRGIGQRGEGVGQCQLAFRICCYKFKSAQTEKPPPSLPLLSLPRAEKTKAFYNIYLSLKVYCCTQIQFLPPPTGSQILGRRKLKRRRSRIDLDNWEELCLI